MPKTGENSAPAMQKSRTVWGGTLKAVPTDGMAAELVAGFGIDTGIKDVLEVSCRCKTCDLKVVA